MISVIMPVYNNVKYLRESIDSILAQTYGDFEFIIIDDASTEPVWNVLESYDDPRIIKQRNLENIGLTKSLNICLDMASGDIIARQDSDDISLPTRFEKELPLMTDNVGLVSCYAYRFNSNGKIRDPWLSSEVRFSDEKIKAYINRANCIVGPAAMYSREAFEKIGYYDETLYLAQDYNYWIRLLQFFDVKLCREVLYALRAHEKSVRTVRSKKDNTDWVQKCKVRAKEHPVIKEKS